MNKGLTQKELDRLSETDETPQFRPSARTRHGALKKAIYAWADRHQLDHDARRQLAKILEDVSI